jgi:hypothetical protein
VASGTRAVPTVKSHLVPGWRAGRTAEWLTPSSHSARRVIRISDSPKDARPGGDIRAPANNGSRGVRELHVRPAGDDGRMARE